MCVQPFGGKGVDVLLYDFDNDLEQVKKRISQMKTNRKNKELLLDFAEDCLFSSEAIGV